MNEEQAHCLFIHNKLDVTFEDKETSLIIYNISYAFGTDRKL